MFKMFQIKLSYNVTNRSNTSTNWNVSNVQCPPTTSSGNSWKPLPKM